MFNLTIQTHLVYLFMYSLCFISYTTVVGHKEHASIPEIYVRKTLLKGRMR